VEIALLTTETPHHAYFAWELARRQRPAAIVVETHQAVAPFDVAHPFERRRDAFERESLLAGRSEQLADVAPTLVVPSANDAEDELRKLRPDVVLVFGTGRLSRAVTGIAPTCLNLHGGHPEHYRGLDTHLWAVYHRDWANLVTTLHVVDDDLDTGDIVAQTAVRLERDMELHALRAANTRACVDLTLDALDALAAGRLPRRQQVQRGRYYSFMPAVLKAQCVSIFAGHTATL
jgi:methionyl-tRNA formyltransferase